MYSARNKNTSKTATIIKGYTVIEILIVVVIMSLLFGVGTASYRNFQRRKELDGATNKVKADLRLAQQMAMSGVKPSGCVGNLESISFQSSSVTTYNLVARCVAGATPTDVTINSAPYNLQPNYTNVTYTFSSGNSVIFNTTGRGVVDPRTIILTHASLGVSRTITITTGGEINVN